MAKDITNACKYYTYEVKSEFNCLNVSWTFLDFSKLQVCKEYPIIIQRYNMCSLDLIFKKYSDKLVLMTRNRNYGIVTLDITATLFNEDGKELESLNKTGASISTTEKTEFLRIYYFKFFEDPNSLPNDTLTIDLEFRIKKVQTSEIFEEIYLDYKTGKKLSNDFNKFILENHPTVVVLKTKDAQIEANKAILCARSSVFKKMFDNPMSEQENDIVLIDDMTGATIKILVDFLNTDEAPDLSKIEYSSLKGVYYAADKYDVQDLRKICAAYILRGLIIENVCGVLEFAKKHSDDHLEKGCMLFFRRNIVAFMESEVWKNLKTTDPALGNIFEFYVKGVTNTK